MLFYSISTFCSSIISFCMVYYFFQCCGNDERLFEQKKVLYLLSYPVLNNYLRTAPSYYQNRASVPINNPYLCHLYYVPSFVLWAQGQIPKGPVSTDIHQSTMQYHQAKHPSFMAILSKKILGKATILSTDAIAAPEQTPVSAAQPTVSAGDTPEVSSQFIDTPDTSVLAEEARESPEDTPEISEFINAPDTAVPSEEPRESAEDTPEISSEFIFSPETSTGPAIASMA